MSRAMLEKIAIGLSVLVMISFVRFYWVQIMDVLELLEMAYG